MKRLLLATAAVLALLGNATAREIINCTGTLIDIETKPGAMWPLAVVYAKAQHTCVIDRGNAGHDPFRGTCDVGGPCTVWGGYQRKIGSTYYLDPYGWHSKGEHGGEER